jgi:para-nitrobenzyl esterase
VIRAPMLPAEGAEPIAETRYGKVRGLRVDKGFRFRGIPYGEDTAQRRFEVPMPPKPWAGVRDAIDYGDRSPQMGPPYIPLYDSWQNPQRESEDCLSLNVFTQALRDGAKRPVMVFYHGGGFFAGSGAARYADGARFSQRQDVVLVTVNHRLNAFGYMALGELASDLPDSGNAGTLDTILALQWVRDNIEEFGGDPDNVTIFGQSGGGTKVSVLMASPLAKGLFHKAISQSPQSLRTLTVEQGHERTLKVLAALGLKPSQAGDLRSVYQGDLIRALGVIDPWFLPIVDGRTLPRHPVDPDAPEVSRDVALMVGCTRDEVTGIFGGGDESLFHLNWDDVPARIEPMISGLDPAYVIAELRRLRPEATASEICFDALNEATFRGRPHVHAERKYAQGGAPVYRYLFNWSTPVDGGRWGATHSVEHAFVFDNVAISQSMIGDADAHEDLVIAVSGAWAAFARTGNPGWDAFDPDRRATMVFDETSEVVSDPLQEQRLLFDGHRVP